MPGWKYACILYRSSVGKYRVYEMLTVFMQLFMQLMCLERVVLLSSLRTRS